MNSFFTSRVFELQKAAPSLSTHSYKGKIGTFTHSGEIHDK